MKPLPFASLLLSLIACAPTVPPPAPQEASATPAPAPKPKSDDARMAQLVDLFVRARALQENLPTQRFWVWINDQASNPWNTRSGKAMTWKLRDVKDKVCLVGSDETTNPYQGDTALEESLPILCIRRSRLNAPAGVDPDNFYAGWSGGEIRLTRPVPGRELTSPQIAHALAEQEFGEGWRMAEFHDTSRGGWAWWAYWESAPERHP